MVVFDSKWGNTERIAQAVASGISPATKAVSVGDAAARDLEKVDLLVVGSPILGGRPSEAMQKYIDGIPESAASRMKIATFDTRLAMKFARLFGYAAVRMTAALTAKGGTAKSEPEGFIVKGRSGPLADGEIERAAQWGRELAKD